MEESEIYYVDGRNADFRHPGSGTPVIRPGQPVRTMVAQPARVYTPQQMSPQIIYAGSPSVASSVLGRISGAQIVDLVTQIFAALMPLPAAPVGTTDTSTDVQNMITYQTALAQHAKRDEQVRTLGNLILKLIG